MHNHLYRFALQMGNIHTGTYLWKYLQDHMLYPYAYSWKIFIFTTFWLTFSSKERWTLASSSTDEHFDTEHLHFVSLRWKSTQLIKCITSPLKRSQSHQIKNVMYGNLCPKQIITDVIKHVSHKSGNVQTTFDTWKAVKNPNISTIKYMQEKNNWNSLCFYVTLAPYSILSLTLVHEYDTVPGRQKQIPLYVKNNPK